MSDPRVSHALDLADQMETWADAFASATTSSLLRQAASSVRWQANWCAKHPEAAMFRALPSKDGQP